MTRKLILMRHAKSDWGDPGLEDIDRPLNERGRMSSVAVAKWLVANGHVPDRVLVSGALRSTETWTQMAAVMPDRVTMESNLALYMASADTILSVLKTQSAPNIMVICHNPGIASFAARIVVDPPDHERFTDYPTAATTVMQFDVDTWSGIGWAEGRLDGFVIPRELPQ